MGENCYKVIYWGKHAANDPMDPLNVLPEEVDNRDLSAPAPRLYTCIWKPFSKIPFSKTAWPVRVKFYVEPLWEGGYRVYINGLGHMIKMAVTPIYGKNLQNYFQGWQNIDRLGFPMW